MRSLRMPWLLPALVAALVGPRAADAACCYFSAQNTDILQPAQKVFITWDPAAKSESFTVQPKFEGNALDFGMVIPTPTQPKLHEMPRDFFKHLAFYSILKKREFPQSKLLPVEFDRLAKGNANGLFRLADSKTGEGKEAQKKPAVVVLEAGVVGSLDYKIIEAERADALYKWLKDNKYSFAGDEASLNFYVQQKWIFTVMKIDTMQMKKNKDGSYNGEVTPTRFSFTSEKLVYPLKITQISVKDQTEALFYVQAPRKVDLEGDMTYQYTWVPMIQSARGCTGFPEGTEQWIKAINDQIPALLQRGQALDFRFTPGQRPSPNKQGRIPTTMEWSRKLTADDLKVLRGQAPYAEKVPDVDEGFTQADINDPMKRDAVMKVIRMRLEKAHQERPLGYLVREAPADDLKGLAQLAGHLREGLFITKFRKTFTRDEMNADLTLVAARLGQQEDSSEYQEILPTSPP